MWMGLKKWEEEYVPKKVECERCGVRSEILESIVIGVALWLWFWGECGLWNLMVDVVSGFWGVAGTGYCFVDASVVVSMSSVHLV